MERGKRWRTTEAEGFSLSATSASGRYVIPTTTPKERPVRNRKASARVEADSLLRFATCCWLTCLLVTTGLSVPLAQGAPLPDPGDFRRLRSRRASRRGRFELYAGQHVCVRIAASVPDGGGKRFVTADRCERYPQGRRPGIRHLFVRGDRRRSRRYRSDPYPGQPLHDRHGSGPRHRIRRGACSHGGGRGCADRRLQQRHVRDERLSIFRHVEHPGSIGTARRYAAARVHAASRRS